MLNTEKAFSSANSYFQTFINILRFNKIDPRVVDRFQYGFINFRVDA
ncbi:hypothetical protein D1AOALGA4SA_1483 [Olavius algarvensis Delta 1 endosymbiont]|nr:hypothetical protein D1AOALGA4SA_1483 [Olavius algarvensis Delta 1 endosymbiont]